MATNPEELRAKGNWIGELKRILGQGPSATRTPGAQPKSAHRSTKTAVSLLLANLRTGATGTADVHTSEDDIRKVVFNAVDQLVADKVSESKKHKTKLDALTKFKSVLDQQFAAQLQKKNPLDKAWKDKIDSVLQALRREELERIILADEGDADSRDAYRKEMLGSNEGRAVLAAKPAFAGKVLSAVDPVWLTTNLDDMDAAFGANKNKILAEALLAVSGKGAASGTKPLDRNTELDPALFKLLARKVEPKVWNDQKATGGALKGLGPRVCLALWRSGQHDEICELIDHGVDTSLATRVNESEGKGGGIYSGFVQPLQHITSKYLRHVATLDANQKLPTGILTRDVKGAKKILAALEKKGTAVTATTWSQVKNSPMLTAFDTAPGTIWGFEDIRLPYVQAAHETGKGAQPLRMMELWEAVELSLTPEAYERLIDDPEHEIDKLVASGVEKIEAGMKSSMFEKQQKFDDVKGRKDEYIDAFKRDAKAFLQEFAAQLPRGTYARSALDGKGVKQEDVVSQLGGIQSGKFMGGLACKAGLWWAKKENKPVYYCLDGIKLDDVIDYKKQKNAAIEDYLAGAEGAKGHDEVITMVELREILKNWKLKDDPAKGEGLEGTVKFVIKGRILDDVEAEKLVADVQAKMKLAAQKYGPTPAPPRARLANELKAIDPGLMGEIDKAHSGATDAEARRDRDARDVVKKFGYLRKVAKARPQLVIKYVISRCDLLVDYGLLSKQLPTAAREFAQAKVGEKDGRKTVLEQEIGKCHAELRAPLKAALLAA
jgi:hypothetical protein